MVPKGITGKFVLLGEKELQRFLRELPRRSVKKALRQAVNAGANPIVKGVRNDVPVQSGLMKRSVKKKVKSYRNGNAIALVGANTAISGVYKGQKRVPGNYWHLVMGGTRPHSLGKGSQLKRRDRNNKEVQHGAMHPGSRGRNSLEIVMTAERGRSRTLMQNKMGEVLTKEAAKLANK